MIVGLIIAGAAGIGMFTCIALALCKAAAEGDEATRRAFQAEARRLRQECPPSVDPRELRLKDNRPGAARTARGMTNDQ